MPAYHLTSDAQSDLIDIRRYTLSQWGRQQSQKYIAEMRQTMQLLAENPALGKPRPDITSGAFSFPYSSHSIYYAQHGELLIVFGVLHKRMIPSNHLERRNIS